MTDLERLEQEYGADILAADAAFKAGREPPLMRSPEQILGRPATMEEAWLGLEMIKAWARGCFDSSNPPRAARELAQTVDAAPSPRAAPCCSGCGQCRCRS